jgi:hypothetical protein
MWIVSLLGRDLSDSPGLSVFPEVPASAVTRWKCHLLSFCSLSLPFPLPSFPYPSPILSSFLWISLASFKNQLKCCHLCKAFPTTLCSLVLLRCTPISVGAHMVLPWWLSQPRIFLLNFPNELLASSTQSSFCISSTHTILANCRPLLSCSGMN